MKRFYATFCILFLLAQLCFSQAIIKSDNAINLYYGLNLTEPVIATNADTEQINLKSKTQGPVGIVYEHLFTKVIAIGIELSYLRGDLYFEQQDVLSNKLYNYAFNYSSMFVGIRENLHFTRRKKFDAYFIFGVNMNILAYTYTTNDPYYIPVVKPNSTTFGIKFGLGLRYFIVKNLAIHAELAFGMPIICGGLTFKF